MVERELKTEHLQDNAGGISRAAELLRAGALVSFPTETVYGLGANATDDRAVARIFEAKGRPHFNPLIVHLPSVDAVSEYAELSGITHDLAHAFWPGPLTLVLPLKPNGPLSALVSAGLPTVAVRVPAHALAQKVLEAAGVPVAAPSANPSGRISPSTAQHVLDGLSGRIEAVLDGGPCGVGVESTIVGIEPTPVLLRPGGLPVEALEAALGAPLAVRGDGAAINAPGQMTSHYAPNAQMRLNAERVLEGERLLGFGPVDAALNLSPSGDLVEAAANLFGFLHRLDAEGDAPIAVSPIPDHGLGRAINDRLRRAAAPRD
ncbi:translation factor SUA5 [Aliiroseovarius halocynthiae]|uniref:Threonylcarbamoyl-AMP synthase n=1 Tax=Aliiroseovarius halocynthiae TaxID=985055 RepID=A0A545SN16_9RHOB|nr:L-threonylcarbamoyladenylate synthase [Aliiroseovarius halocynthiae]TQV66382.1 threonylcarbamoyl-AMP synthase [Aliiroseovarius halocynthiae]SMR83358.1 translation factor SUA5 [Aliiroseovarius halocynthiae]